MPLPTPLARRCGIRRIKIVIPIPPRLSQSVTGLGLSSPPRWLRNLLYALVALALFLNLYCLAGRLGTPLPRLPFQKQATTRVFSLQDIRRIWEWEVASGHYQSGREIPVEVALETPLLNPGLPPAAAHTAHRLRTGAGAGSGLQRTYLSLQSPLENVAYPPRPVPGSIADLDIVMEQCDFSLNKYVRDCLEVLRVGAGLDNGRRVRRGDVGEWRYIYVEEGQRLSMTVPPRVGRVSLPAQPTRKAKNLEPPLRLPPPRPYWTSAELSTACDPDHPRIFHIFWGGPFTDKPYMTLLSFLFTQNLGLHQPLHAAYANLCRPQVWVWIQTGVAREANPKPTALEDMFDSLKSNPWSAPFLHPRLRDIIKFKLWNTTEQLDGVHELKDEWRDFNIFNSGGHVIRVPKESDAMYPGSASGSAGNRTAPHARERPRNNEDMLNRIGSTSSASYDRMRTILSDMARFVLCHRFGGIYIDADTIFLRDWEDLWGWKGAFAYRWSRLPLYNTAVLKLNKGSALGTFILRTALRHGLDFHPMSAISAYMKDAYLEGLLLRLPDALFDSAWLNTEYFQRDRPPSPYITDFEQFFDTPVSGHEDPQSVGFEGFFRGAYSYHWHNYWWKAFDAARNWPDLGPRFEVVERAARLQLRKAKDGLHVVTTPIDGAPDSPSEAEEFLWEDRVADDKRDLDWATVLKRTIESYIRGERPNMYGEWIMW